MSLVNLLQALFHNVSIDLRFGNIAVTEHQLDRAKIGAAFQEMRGKTVTKHVRRKRHTQTRLTAVSGEYLPDTDAAETTTATIQEKNGRVSQGALAEKLGSSKSEERRVGKECRSRWSPYH